MKKITIVLVAVLLIQVFFGCSILDSNVDEYNDYIARIDKNISKINKLQEEIRKTLDIKSASISFKEVKKYKKNIDTSIKLMEKGKKYLGEAAKDADKAAGLEVNEESSKYVKMLSNSFRLRIDSYEVIIGSLNDIKKMLQKYEKMSLTNEDKKQIDKALEKMRKGIKLEEKADKDFEKAQDYHKENISN